MFVKPSSVLLCAVLCLPGCFDTQTHYKAKFTQTTHPNVQSGNLQNTSKELLLSSAALNYDYTLSLKGDEQGFNELTLTYGPHQVNLLGNDTQLTRICQLKGTPQLAFEGFTYDPGAGLPTSELYVTSNYGIEAYPLAISDLHKPSGYTLQCKKNDMTSWPSDAQHSISFCQCDVSTLQKGFALEEALTQYLPDTDLNLNQNIDVSTDLVHPLTLETLTITSAKERLEFEYLLEQLAKQFESIEINTSHYRFVQIISINRPLYAKFAYSFVKLEQQWHLVYIAQQSSKGFFPLAGISEASETQLAIEEYCYNNCDWWGKTAAAELNFAEKTISIIMDE
ncbi:hypothetical protein HG263_13035 [Pseudoalteromonas sp. JBTF-M23]|uniref:Uncharacterized protein n=1 Tax=Pseudoalteromonas caenipelagi TaxID=2726988 RepID=A0A849VE97_9GAMM|nr:hypothetical protein [Pseudoalteromonas caenipelagi]NOU51455.1 hypothetical protein [Pseudoalteromonas caenipelagi]